MLCISAASRRARNEDGGSPSLQVPAVIDDPPAAPLFNNSFFDGFSAQPLLRKPSFPGCLGKALFLAQEFSGLTGGGEGREQRIPNLPLDFRPDRARNRESTGSPLTGSQHVSGYGFYPIGTYFCWYSFSEKSQSASPKRKSNSFGFSVLPRADMMDTAR